MCVECARTFNVNLRNKFPSPKLTINLIIIYKGEMIYKDYVFRYNGTFSNLHYKYMYFFYKTHSLLKPN